MGIICQVNGCNNRNTSENIDNPLRFHRVPSVASYVRKEYQEILLKRRNAWIAALKKCGSVINEQKLSNYRICSTHFIRGEPCYFLDTTNPDWVPTMKMGGTVDDLNQESLQAPVEELQILTANTCEVNETREDLDISAPVEVNTCEVNESPEAEDLDISAPVELNTCEVNETAEAEDLDISALHEELKQQRLRNLELENEVKSLMENNLELKKIRLRNSQLENKVKSLQEYNSELRKEKAALLLDKSAFKNDNDKFRYFTALPNIEVVELLLQYIDNSLSKITARKLTNFQKIMLTLMKLRFNTTFQGLGYQFGISEKKASSVFKEVILILEYSFSGLVFWPNRELIFAEMPKSFKDVYGNKITLIIDCFEVGIEKPNLLKSRQETYSTYKSKHTGKFLIGITPQCQIAYISNGWGGRTSDKTIIENSGLLDLVQHGDWILADRGFTCNESFASVGATLITPEFTKGFKQLLPDDVERSRKIASICIHAERVIGNLRNKFTILNGPIPTSLLKLNYQDRNFVDYMVKVCCILHNLCERILPIEETPQTL